MSIEEEVLDTEEIWTENEEAEILPMDAISRVDPPFWLLPLLLSPLSFPIEAISL
jgi:hypothetical protein